MRCVICCVLICHTAMWPKLNSCLYNVYQFILGENVESEVYNLANSRDVCLPPLLRKSKCPLCPSLQLIAEFSPTSKARYFQEYIPCVEFVHSSTFKYLEVLQYSFNIGALIKDNGIEPTTKHIFLNNISNKLKNSVRIQCVSHQHKI